MSDVDCDSEDMLLGTVLCGASVAASKKTQSKSSSSKATASAQSSSKAKGATSAVRLVERPGLITVHPHIRRGLSDKKKHMRSKKASSDKNMSHTLFCVYP